MVVQASAGTGKSFLLTTVFLFCIVNGLPTKSAAPTGAFASFWQDLLLSTKKPSIALLELRHRRGERDDPGYSYQRHDDP